MAHYSVDTDLLQSASFLMGRGGEFGPGSFGDSVAATPLAAAWDEFGSDLANAVEGLTAVSAMLASALGTAATNYETTERRCIDLYAIKDN